MYAETGVQMVIDHLKKIGLYENTLIVFASDNGAQPGDGSAGAAYGQNVPLRGMKFTTFEGGIRTPAFVTGIMVICSF